MRKHSINFYCHFFFVSCSERFCAITPVDLLEKVNLIPKRSSKVIVQRDSRVSNHSGQSLSLSFSDIEQQETNIEKLAYRFNQVRKSFFSFEKLGVGIGRRGYNHFNLC